MKKNTSAGRDEAARFGRGGADRVSGRFAGGWICVFGLDLA